MITQSCQSLIDELVEYEKRVWQALVAGDQKSDAELLDDEFLGVYPSGYASKQDHVDQLAGGPSIASFNLSDFRVIELGNDHAILSYQADYIRFNARISETVMVSSI